MTAPPNGSTAFVLGGGGELGAHEVGMLRALLERDIVPDMVIGTSIGAINGAVLAADPTTEAVATLTELWTTLDRSGVLGGSLIDRFTTLARSGTHLYDNTPMRDLLSQVLSADLIEDLAVPFECVAASIEQATAHYFTSGPLIDAVMASSAVPGLLPPVAIDGEHYLDGGLVASIPLDRAIRRGATTIHVLQVGRVEDPLTAPAKPWEVAVVAFEISRRHRFTESLRSIPDGVDVHVLPTGSPQSATDLRQYLPGRPTPTRERIETSYRATIAYLDSIDA